MCSRDRCVSTRREVTWDFKSGHGITQFSIRVSLGWSGAQGLLLSSLVIGRIPFLVVMGQRPLFSNWLSAEDLSRLPKTTHNTWPCGSLL